MRRKGCLLVAVEEAAAPRVGEVGAGTLEVVTDAVLAEGFAPELEPLL